MSPPRAVVVVGAVIAILLAASPGAVTASEPTVTSPATSVLSLRRVPGLVADQIAANRLVSGLDSALAAAPADACLVVTDAKGVLFARNADLPLVPASTLKLVTAAVALDLWGPDHQFVTSTVAAGSTTEGRLDGDLYLVGGGDPVLGTAGFAASLPGAGSRSRTSLESLADAVVDAGVRQVTGSVIGDGTRHDSARFVPGWDPVDLTGDTVGALGALRVNAGLNGWNTEPGRPGRRGQPGDPALEAAAIFTTLLTDRGVAVGGPPRQGSAPAESSVVARQLSVPLGAILGEVLTWSDNGAAEQLLREIGLATGGSGSTNAGTAAVVAALQRWGLPTAGFVMLDGSGLHTGNRVTCALLSSLMARVSGQSALIENLPLAGASGTLTNRLTEDGTAGLVRAKTGTLDTVRALAGAAFAGDGRLAHFAWVANGARNDPALSTEWPDAAVRVIRRFPERPDLAALGPQHRDG